MRARQARRARRWLALARLALRRWLAAGGRRAPRSPQPAPRAAGARRGARCCRSRSTARGRSRISRARSPSCCDPRSRPSGRVDVVEAVTVRETLIARPRRDAPTTCCAGSRASSAPTRSWSGSAHRAAGRYSLDVRVTPARARRHAHHGLHRAGRRRAARPRERARRRGSSRSWIAGHAGGSASARIDVVGAARRGRACARALRTQRGRALRRGRARAPTSHAAQRFRGVGARGARDRARARRRRACLPLRVVLAEPAPCGAAVAARRGGVAEVRVRGNRRIESDAIRARVATKPGEPAQRARRSRRTCARSTRSASSATCRCSTRTATSGRVAGVRRRGEPGRPPGHDQPATRTSTSDKIRDSLTLTTGSTLDYPLLFENRERIEALYRAEGYYLAKVRSRSRSCRATPSGCTSR